MDGKHAVGVPCRHSIQMISVSLRSKRFFLLVICFAATALLLSLCIIFMAAFSCPAVPVAETTFLPTQVLTNSTASQNDQTELKEGAGVFGLRRAVPQHKKRLELVHIPKTGGSAIEEAARRQKIIWGVGHFQGKYPSIHSAPAWHLTPDHFYHGVLPRNPYQNATLFVVVRNPYTRIISEYYFRHLAVRNRSLEDVENTSHFNSFIGNQLRRMTHAKRARMVGTSFELGDPAYYQFNGHFIPQYDYVYCGQRRMVDHVLHFESLQEEFEILMRMYALSNVQLPQKTRGRPSEQLKKSLGVANLTLNNIRLIDTVYARDFAAFGYQAMSQVAS